MVAVIDYDAGNIRSVEKAVEALGKQAVVTRRPEEILTADHVILPGVGAFGDAMEKLRKYELAGIIRETAARGTPFLGICLGLQLLFDNSERRRRRAWHFTWQNCPDSGGKRFEDSAYRMEFAFLSASGQAFCRDTGAVLCVFCTFLLFAGRRGGNRKGDDGVRR